NASFEDKRKIVELLIEEIIVTNGKVEIFHIIPIEKKGNLQLHGSFGVILPGCASAVMRRCKAPGTM
ncbi:hypothetical protein KJ582_03105, partial [bacterium]|nr:hypothetical protein [bacterium]